MAQIKVNNVAITASQSPTIAWQTIRYPTNRTYNFVLRQSSLPLNVTITYSGFNTNDEIYLDSLDSPNSTPKGINQIWEPSSLYQYYAIRYSRSISQQSVGQHPYFTAPQLNVPLSSASGTITFKFEFFTHFKINDSEIRFHWQPTTHGPFVSRGEKITASKMNDVKNYICNLYTYTYKGRVDRPPALSATYPPQGDLLKFRERVGWGWYGNQGSHVLLGDGELQYYKFDLYGPSRDGNYWGLCQANDNLKGVLATADQFNYYDLYGLLCPWGSNTPTDNIYYV